jgi:hypothetical protein
MQTYANAFRFAAFGRPRKQDFPWCKRIPVFKLSEIPVTKRGLEKADPPASTEQDFLSFWRMEFDDAGIIMKNSQEELQRIADYCMANLDRDISASELFAERLL